MQRVKRSTAVAVLPAAPTGGTPGYFAQPDPGGGIPATVPGFEWYNSIQEEICAIISAAGIALNVANTAQFLAALRSTGVFQTPAQFDNTTKAATTAFVQRALGSCSTVWTFSAAQALSNLNAGNLIILAGAGGFAVTLPTTASCPNGTKLQFFSTQSAIAIQRTGADQLNAGNALINSVIMNSGDTLELTSTGASWVISGGSIALAYAPGLAAGVTGLGYQKLPSGLIVQWGAGTTNGSGILTQTMAMTYPTTWYGGVANLYGVGGNVLCAIASQNASSIQINSYLANTGAVSPNQQVAWLSWGK